VELVTAPFNPAPGLVGEVSTPGLGVLRLEGLADLGHWHLAGWSPGEDNLAHGGGIPDRPGGRTIRAGSGMGCASGGAELSVASVHPTAAAGPCSSNRWDIGDRFTAQAGPVPFVGFVKDGSLLDPSLALRPGWQSRSAAPSSPTLVPGDFLASTIAVAGAGHLAAQLQPERLLRYEFLSTW
jgi:hypothetical protein